VGDYAIWECTLHRQGTYRESHSMGYENATFYVPLRGLIPECAHSHYGISIVCGHMLVDHIGNILDYTVLRETIKLALWLESMIKQY